MKDCPCGNYGNFICPKCKEGHCKKCHPDHILICGVAMVGKERYHLLLDKRELGLSTEEVHALLNVARMLGDETASITAIARERKRTPAYIYNVIAGAKSKAEEIYIISKIKPALPYRNMKGLVDLYRNQRKTNHILKSKLTRARNSLEK